MARYSDDLMNSKEPIADPGESTTDSEPQIKHAKQVVKARSFKGSSENGRPAQGYTPNRTFDIQINPVQSN